MSTGTIQGTPGNDTVRIVLDAGNSSQADVFSLNNTNSTPTYAIPLDSFSQWNIGGSTAVIK